ncbi:MAG: hypothetical protein IT306_10330 [Chloroflexi bacterium]|nr:hypothetical protein [Chloroflexota bacterium]
MQRRATTRCAGWVRRLRALGGRLVGAARRAWQILHRWRRPIPVEILVADRARHRRLQRDLRLGLRRLERALGGSFPRDVAIVVQQVICTDRQLAGCYQLGLRPGGDGFALIRLALQVDGRWLETDELLAALAEQCIGLALHEGGGTGVLVPIELEPTGRSADGSVSALRPDPLAPAPGAATVRRIGPAA